MTDGEREQLDEPAARHPGRHPRGVERQLRPGPTPWEVQFVWEPSYDYRFTLHEAGPSSISDGGISIIVGTRYPDDELPLPQPRSSSKSSTK